MEKEKENESKEVSDKEKMLSLAKDLVELAIQSQKVLAGSAISYSHIEEARLLAIMTNSVIEQYTEKKEEKEEKDEA